VRPFLFLTGLSLDKETDVLNEVVLEGWFTGKAWHYAGDLFFRLSNYRDRQCPAKPQVEGREQPDYITIRIPASGVPLALQKGAFYRVHGFLQSREYKETLGDYIKSAHGLTNMLSVSDELRREITHNRAITQVVAERLAQVDCVGSDQMGQGVVLSLALPHFACWRQSDEGGEGLGTMWAWSLMKRYLS